MRCAIATVVVLVAAAASPAWGRDGPAARLRGNPGAFFGADAYPPDALRNHEQGRTVATLTIARDGHVTDCAIRESSGSAALDGATCRIALDRVTFTPAADADGRPIESRYTLPVRWVLRMAALASRASTDERLTVTLDAADRVETCGYTRDDVLETGDHPFCTRWRNQGGPLARRLRARAGPGRIVLTLQRAVSFPGHRVPEVQATAGRTVLGMRRAFIDILPDGAAANEQIVEQSGTQDGAIEPIATLHRFVPAAATVRIQVLIAASYAALP